MSRQKKQIDKKTKNERMNGHFLPICAKTCESVQGKGNNE